MASVIEHQRIQRRRQNPRHRSLLRPGSRARKAPVAGTPVGVTSSALVNQRTSGSLWNAPRRYTTFTPSRRPARRAAQMLGAAGEVLMAAVDLTLQALLRAWNAAVRPAMGSGARLVAKAASRAIVFDERDVPVYAAALVFSVLANTMLLSVDIERIILSSRTSQVRLPEPIQLVTQSTFAPATDDFSVIGEIAGVDPSRFSRLEVSEYTVQPGETLGELAIRFGLEMDTIISFNQIEDVRRLQAGATYQIPNRDGLLYTVKAGDSVASIAAAHSTTVNAILDVNDMRSQDLQTGQVLFVPGARLNRTELRLILGELFAWPTQGRFTSGFGMRADPFTGLPRFHNGIDLANRPGTPIRSAAAGRVVHVESQIGNYGRFVIVRHPDGYQTLYAHLDLFQVRNGQTVSRGQILGTMGNTGRSTGPHLHFSVIHNGTFVDPLRYLH